MQGSGIPEPCKEFRQFVKLMFDLYEKDLLPPDMRRIWEDSFWPPPEEK